MINNPKYIWTEQKVVLSLRKTFDEVKHTYRETFKDAEYAAKNYTNCCLAVNNDQIINETKNDILEIKEHFDRIVQILSKINPDQSLYSKGRSDS